MAVKPCAAIAAATRPTSDGAGVAQEARVRAHARLRAPAEQPPHRHAERLAREVPQREVDAGEGEHAEAAAAPDHHHALQAVDVRFEPRGVLADEEGAELLVDHVAHRERRAVREGLAPAREAAVRVDADEHLLGESAFPRRRRHTPAHRDRERNRSHAGDLHQGLGVVRNAGATSFRNRRSWPA